MKTLFLKFAGWALRKLCNASAELWENLEHMIRMVDQQPGRTNEERHAIVDAQLATMPGFDGMPTLRRRLIQAGVLWVRLKTYWGELPPAI